ncbi:MAG: hypothetical protein ACK5P4_02955 [Bacteroidota bacterium]
MINELLNLLLLYLLMALLPAYFIFNWINHQTENIKASVVLSLGIAPLLMSSLLYLMLLFLPGQSTVIYLLIAFSVLIGHMIFFRKKFNIAYAASKYPITFDKTEKILASLLLVFFVCTLAYSHWRPLSEHDTFEYMFLGKQLALEKQLIISKYRYNEASGSYFIGLHGLLYPVLFTWQSMFNQLMHTDSEWWFKSLSGYYSMLFLSVFILYLKSINPKWLVLGLCMLLSSFAMVFSILQFHLEMIRMFLFLAVVYMSITYIESPRNQINILGILLGLQAGVHFIGLVISIISLGLLFFFIQQTYAMRFKMLMKQSIIFILCGSIHYILEYFMGDGYWWQKITGN